jgi:serine/threonine protein kinase
MTESSFCSKMDLKGFTFVAVLGEGSFGSVSKMLDTSSAASAASPSFVAVKTLAQKFETFSSVVALREVQCLMKVSDHSNIVRLLQVIREGTT